jgi:hypothetical protein
MDLPLAADRWDIARLTQERAEAVGAFGFTPRQARFLVEVLIHSGVFVERQYCHFAAITHGQKTTDFLRRLVERGHARPIATGAPHRGRLFHLHHKPMYAAIEQADNRYQKPMTLGRMVERLMVLDAVLADRTCTWLGTEFDKRSYFTRRLRERVKLDEFPRLTFGTGTPARHRYFPDKLAIGISDGDENHVFVYLVTSGVPMDFRLFLLRHAEVLRGLYRWTVRVLVPSPFVPAIRLFGQAARETLATPLAPSNAEALCSVFRGRQRRRDTPSAPADPQLRSLSLTYSAPRFRALFRAWQQLGDPVVWAAQSGGLRDALQRGEGRVEFVKLTHQYCHLSSLVGVA